MVDNPFDLVYNKLWEILEKDTRFADSVRPANRIKFISREDSAKSSHSTTSDYPNVVLFAGAITGNLNNTSSSSKLSREYLWLISAGDYRYSELFAVEWAIIAGMSVWCKELTTLKWMNELFVKVVRFIAGDTEKMEKQLKVAGLNGHVSIITIEVEMHFKTSDLRIQ